MKTTIQIIALLFLVIGVNAEEPDSSYYKSLVGKTIHYNTTVQKIYTKKGKEKRVDIYHKGEDFTFAADSIVADNVWKILKTASKDLENSNFACYTYIEESICFATFVIKPDGVEILQYINNKKDDTIVIYKNE